MEKITLSNFADNYATKQTSLKNRTTVLSELIIEDLLTETTVSDNEDNSPDLKKEHNQIYKMIKTTKFIRYAHFNPNTDEENYCREQLMLFSPWRN